MTQPTTEDGRDRTVHATPRRFTTHDGLTLAYEDAGNPDGDPIVFLHGGTDCRLTWARVTPEVRDTHRLLLLDARGQGESDADPDGYDLLGAFPGDVIALCEQVLDRPAMLVGASHGAAIAAAVAALRPELVRGLLLLDPPLFGRIPPWVGELLTTVEHMLAAVASSDDRQAAVRSLLAAGPMADVFDEDGLDRLAFAWSRVDPAFVKVAAAAVAVEEPFGPAKPMSCPMLVVRGDPSVQPPCFRAEDEFRLRQLAPEARFVVAEGLGHAIHPARPAWVAEQLNGFLASL
jgi:pimeloyl-ACP methyl ester carboxylesterase